MIYENIKRNKNNVMDINPQVTISYIQGATVNINAENNKDYKIQFIDSDTNHIHYETTIGNNCWAKCNIEYFVNWEIRVYKNNEIFYTEKYNANNKRIYIAFDSKALGDTLAWMGSTEEFKKKHNCKLVVSTFHNHLFETQYPDIEFVTPGDVVPHLYAMYSIGLFYTNNNSINHFKNPSNFLERPLQKMCSDILGITHKEIKPKLIKKDIKKDDKLITIAIHGTAQPKYWNNTTGWQEVVDWLNDKGYRVKLLSKEQSGFMGNFHPKGIETHPWGPLELVMDEMRKSKAFIGIGSGLSWLSWALGTKTVLISGFSYDWAEMEDCVRITSPNDMCGGCFNRMRLDAGDWNWCPDHKGTNRQFECTKSITGQMVINELEKFL